MINAEIFWYRARIEIDKKAAKFFNYKKKSYKVGEGVVYRDTL